LDVDETAPATSVTGDADVARRGVDTTADSSQFAETGTQPERDGKLVCLECGAGYRQLGQHVVAKHAMTTAQYRARHQPPAGMGLHCSEVRQRRSQRGRKLFEQDPDDIRRRLTPRTPAAERLEAAHRARQATAARAGVNAQTVANGRNAARAWTASVDREFDEHARRLGYRDLHEMLAAVSELHAREVADLLGVNVGRVQTLRVRHRAERPGRWPQPDSSDLDQLPAGVQPAAEGRWRCLECGGWYKALCGHLREAHDLGGYEYKRLHGLGRHTRITPRD
jgi:predicted transcriptional regulator